MTKLQAYYPKLIRGMQVCALIVLTAGGTAGARAQSEQGQTFKAYDTPLDARAWRHGGTVFGGYAGGSDFRGYTGGGFDRGYTGGGYNDTFKSDQGPPWKDYGATRADASWLTTLWQSALRIASGGRNNGDTDVGRTATYSYETFQPDDGVDVSGSCPVELLPNGTHFLPDSCGGNAEQQALWLQVLTWATVALGAMALWWWRDLVALVRMSREAARCKYADAHAELRDLRESGVGGLRLALAWMSTYLAPVGAFMLNFTAGTLARHLRSR